MVRPPEGLALTHPSSLLACRLALLNLKIESEQIASKRQQKQVCEKTTLTFRALEFPDCLLKFPVRARKIPCSAE
jgi:hypothetical protein